MFGAPPPGVFGSNNVDFRSTGSTRVKYRWRSESQQVAVNRASSSDSERQTTATPRNTSQSVRNVRHQHTPRQHTTQSVNVSTAPTPTVETKARASSQVPIGQRRVIEYTTFPTYTGDRPQKQQKIVKACELNSWITDFHFAEQEAKRKAKSGAGAIRLQHQTGIWVRVLAFHAFM